MSVLSNELTWSDRLEWVRGMSQDAYRFSLTEGGYELIGQLIRWASAGHTAKKLFEAVVEMTPAERETFYVLFARGQWAGTWTELLTTCRVFGPDGSES